MKALSEENGKPSFSRKTGAVVVGVTLFFTGFVLLKVAPETVGSVFNWALTAWLTFAGALYGINKLAGTKK